MNLNLHLYPGLLEATDAFQGAAKRIFPGGDIYDKFSISITSRAVCITVLRDFQDHGSFRAENLYI